MWYLSFIVGIQSDIRLSAKPVKIDLPTITSHETCVSYTDPKIDTQSQTLSYDIEADDRDVTDKYLTSHFTKEGTSETWTVSGKCFNRKSVERKWTGLSNIFQIHWYDPIEIETSVLIFEWWSDQFRNWFLQVFDCHGISWHKHGQSLNYVHEYFDGCPDFSEIRT